MRTLLLLLFIAPLQLAAQTSSTGDVTRTPPEGSVHTYVDEVAQFPGGLTGLGKFLREHMIYPQSAKDLAIEGKCYLQFVVSATGRISNIVVLRGVTDCTDCDKEAIRVVKAMPDWIPAKIGGQVVDSYFNLPVSFILY